MLIKNVGLSKFTIAQGEILPGHSLDIPESVAIALSKVYPAHFLLAEQPPVSIVVEKEGVTVQPEVQPKKKRK